MLTIGGRSIPGFTVNGTSPGPEIRAKQGQLIEVHLHNESVAAGVALHWHGLDVPNAMDGVAGVTQDAVPVGGEFIPLRGRSGWLVLVSLPPGLQPAGCRRAARVAGGDPAAGRSTAGGRVALAHTYGGVRTINGKAGDLRVEARPSQRVRVRVTNTDNGPMQIWTGGSYRLLAIDGAESIDPARSQGDR